MAALFLGVDWKRLASVFVPAALIAAVSVYVLGYRDTAPLDLKVLPGRPLATYEDLYPIRADDAGALYLDPERFTKALDYFADHPSPRAVADLIYLGNSNNVTLLLNSAAKAKYMVLAEQPDYAALAEADRQKDRVFQSYRDIVNGIGQTFAGTPIEVILHDTRNPLRSIIAIQNPISGRRLGDTNTNFGLQLIKNYAHAEGQGQGRGGAFVSYDLTLKNGVPVKSTTIPIFHDAYGLIGLLCINVDVSKLDPQHPDALARFIENFKATTPNDAVSEMIQNAKRKD